MGPILTILGILFFLGLLFFAGLKSIFYNCAPNEVLIFSGGNRRVGDSTVRYRLVKGGFGVRIPLIERVDRLDLTNMIIELTASNAYSKGGIPLNVNGVANVKVAGHEPTLNRAIERFLGKGRNEIMQIAKANLEGSLRGVLATLTPEQVNQDRAAFAERLVAEVEQDLSLLGLVVDTLKIQNVSDDVGYLNSIGRIRSAELNSSARIAEAKARAESVIASAKNRETEVRAQITAQMNIARADAERKLKATLSQRNAVIAEEQASVAAQIAKSIAEVEVQKARIEQVRRKLEAEVIEPSKANCEAMEAKAKALVAPIVEEGKAKADAFRALAESWQRAGDNAREILILQKIEPIIRQLTDAIADTKIDKVTIIDSGNGSSPNTSGVDVGKLLAINEQIKTTFGIDLAEKIKEFPAPKQPIVIKTEAPSQE